MKKRLMAIIKALVLGMGFVSFQRVRVRKDIIVNQYVGTYLSKFLSRLDPRKARY
jgi:hypothetical protein